MPRRSIRAFLKCEPIDLTPRCGRIELYSRQNSSHIHVCFSIYLHHQQSHFCSFPLSGRRHKCFRLCPWIAKHIYVISFLMNKVPATFILHFIYVNLNIVAWQKRSKTLKKKSTEKLPATHFRALPSKREHFWHSLHRQKNFISLLPF